jgi:YHS domain-containing protein
MEQTEKTKVVHKKFVTLCGRILRDTDPQYFPCAQYRGRTIYFCTESCRGAFLADPEIFYKVHRKSKKSKDTI